MGNRCQVTGRVPRSGKHVSFLTKETHDGSNQIFKLKNIGYLAKKDGLS